MTKIRKPKKPLSAYNLFFQEQREKMLCYEDYRRGGEGYANMAREIAANWTTLDKNSRSHYVKQAKEEKKNHVRALAEWKLAKKMKRTDSIASDSSASTSPSSSSEGEASAAMQPIGIGSMSPFKNDIHSGVMDEISEWADYFGDSDDDETRPIETHLSLTPDFARENPSGNVADDVLDVSSDSALEKQILETINDMKSSVDEDFVGFMSSFFE